MLQLAIKCLPNAALINDFNVMPSCFLMQSQFVCASLKTKQKSVYLCALSSFIKERPASARNIGLDSTSFKIDTAIQRLRVSFLVQKIHFVRYNVNNRPTRIPGVKIGRWRMTAVDDSAYAGRVASQLIDGPVGTAVGLVDG